MSFKRCPWASCKLWCSNTLLSAPSELLRHFKHAGTPALHSCIDKDIQRVDCNIPRCSVMRGLIGWSWLHVHGRQAIDAREEETNNKTAGSTSTLVH